MVVCVRPAFANFPCYVIVSALMAVSVRGFLLLARWSGTPTFGIRIPKCSADTFKQSLITLLLLQN